MTESKHSSESRFRAWCRKWLAGMVLLLIVTGMIVWIVSILASNKPDKASWLLVPITVIYAVFTLSMAAAAFQNAVATRRSAEAMEASVEEQRQSRWAAFAAILSFTDGYKYRVDTDGSALIVLRNLYRQPIRQLHVRLWDMEPQSTGEGQIKYSTMKESSPTDVEADTASVTVRLHATSRPESERVRIANLALERFREFFQGAAPVSALCLITYSHRAQIWETVFVFDLQREEVQV